MQKAKKRVEILEGQIGIKGIDNIQIAK